MTQSFAGKTKNGSLVTMKDVARLAGVSTATVSRILRDPDAGTEETVQRVMDAVRKLNYEPNVLARNLRKQETRFVIVVLPDITNPFFSRILRGMEDTAQAAGYNVLLCNTDNDPARELTYIKILQRRGADGIIFLTARVDKSHILQLSHTLPVVLACEYVEGLPVPMVSIDNLSAAFTAVNHLLQLGHKRIAMINGPGNVILCRERLTGYRLALQQAGISFDPALVRNGTFHHDSGVEAMKSLLEEAGPLTAVFCANDEMAIGAINCAKSRGLRVPEDLAVVGFDDIDFASMYDPPVTTVAQPMYQIGETAMRLLLSKVRGEPVAEEQVVLPYRLVVRRSSVTG